MPIIYFHLPSFYKAAFKILIMLPWDTGEGDASLMGNT